MKLQTVTLAAKLLVLSPADRTLTLLARYVLTLARYDLDYDVRDRARTLGALLAGVCPGLHGDGDDGGDGDGARDDLPARLFACSSGRELVEKGFADDVEVAGRVDVSETVPVLEGERLEVGGD